MTEGNAESKQTAAALEAVLIPGGGLGLGGSCGLGCRPDWIERSP